MEEQFQTKMETDETDNLKFVGEELKPKGDIQQQQSIKVEEMLVSPDKEPEKIMVLDNVLDKATIAKRQLELLNHKERKPRKQNITNTEKQITVKSDKGDEASYILSSRDQSETITRVEPLKIPHNSNLSSSILSRAEFNNVILTKVVKNENIRVSSTSKHEDFVGTIEIPQELILSQELTSSSRIIINESQPQLQSQELIDILEGNETDQPETYEIVDPAANNNVNRDNEGDFENYQILEELEFMNDETKKMNDREIALNQIRNLPVKNRGKAKSQGITRKTATKNLVQTLVSEWSDDDKNDSENGKVSSTTLTYELLNNQAGTSKVSSPIILNQIILNKQEVKEPKSSVKILNMEILTKDQEIKIDIKPEIKILNKEAPHSSNSGFINQAVMNKIKSKLPEPKILNKLAPKADDPPLKTSRVIKRKTIWDPSDRSLSAPEIKPKLPAGITIKKVTSLIKEEIVPEVEVLQVKAESEDPAIKVTVTSNKKPVKKKSEIEKLLGDEGAVNMLNSLENPTPIVQEQPDDVAEKPKKPVKKETPKVKKTPPIVSVAKRQKPPVIDISKAQKKTPAKKKKNDTGWDYVYNNQCDDSMIIRRRSNSSYSSSAPTSPRRLSLDQNGSGEGKSSASIDGTFEFKQPPGKVPQSPAAEILTPNLIAEMKGKMKKVINKAQNKKVDKEVVVNQSAKKRAASVGLDEPVSKGSRVSERKSNSGEYKEIQLKRFDAYVEIVLLPQERGDLNVLTNEILTEVKTALNALRTDNSCKLVLFTIAGDGIDGLDFTNLLQSTVDSRKKAGSDLATALKNFLVSLATFPKLLVCGVSGSVWGLGVTMLPVFDIVIASHKTTFQTIYGKLGHIPEALSLVKGSGRVSYNAISDLFYLGETLTSELALKYGLVTKVLITTGDQFQEDLTSYCKNISTQSSQFLESTKSILNEDALESVETLLVQEMKSLQQQWISHECQEKFKQFSSKKNW